MISPAASDLTKDGVTLLVGLINNQEKYNTRPLTNTDIVVGVPSATPDGSAKNTQVTITATAECLYQGNVTITYDRLDLAAVIGKKLNITINDTTPLPINTNAGAITTVAQIVAMLNNPQDGLGIYIGADDFVDGPVDSSVLPVNVSIPMTAGSLRFINHLPVQLTQAAGGSV